MDSAEHTTRATVDLAAIDARLSALGPVPSDLAQLMQQYLGDERLSAECADQLLAQLGQPGRVEAPSESPAPFRPSEPQRAEALPVGEVQSGELAQVEQFQTGEVARPDELRRSGRPSQLGYDADIAGVTAPRDVPLSQGVELQPTIPDGSAEASEARFLEDGFEILVDDELSEQRTI